MSDEQRNSNQPAGSASSASSGQNVNVIRQQQLHHRHNAPVQRNYASYQTGNYIYLASRNRNLNEQRTRVPKFEPVAEDQTEDYHAYETRYSTFEKLGPAPKSGIF